MQKTDRFFTARNLQYLALFLVFLVCILLTDEGRKPLIYNADELKRQDAELTSTIFTPKFLFNKGTYNVNIAFGDLSGASSPKVELWKQSEKLNEWKIDPSADNFSSDFTLPHDCQDVQFRFSYTPVQQALLQTELSPDLHEPNDETEEQQEIPPISKLTISSKTFFYSDTYFMVALFLLLAVFANIYLYKNRGKIEQQKIIDFCLLLGISIFCTFPFFNTTNIGGHDLQSHLGRIEGIKDGILDGQFGVNILPQGVEDYGYLNALYPYLFLYIPAFLRFCRTSLMFSYKFFIFIINFATAISVYCSAKSMAKSRLNIFLAVILYELMPFRLTNIFVRSALGEILATTFWPLVIAGIYNIIIGDQKKWHFLLIGIAGMIQSHILSAMLAAVFCCLAVFAFIVKIFKEKRYAAIMKTVAFAFFLDIWFIVPFLYYFIQADENCALMILDISNYFEWSQNVSSLPLTFLPNPMGETRYTSLGLHFIFAVGICFLSLFCAQSGEHSKSKSFSAFLLALGLFTTFALTNYFPNRFLIQHSQILRKIFMTIQFPFRLFVPASAFIVFAMLLSLEESKILKAHKEGVFTLLMAFSFLPLISFATSGNQFAFDNYTSIATKGHKQKLTPNLLYVFEYNNYDMTSAYDKALKETFTSSSGYFAPKPVATNLDAVTISDFRKNGTKLSFSYTAKSQGEFVEVPLQWYSGYKAFDENKKALPIEKSELGKIRLPLLGDDNEHKIFVRYGPNLLFIIANIVSALTLAFCEVLVVRKKRANNPHNGRAALEAFPK